MNSMNIATETAQAPVHTPEMKTHPRLDRLVSAGVTAALVAVLGLLFAAMVFPAMTGRTPMTILTGSMQPSLPPGHIVIYGPVNPAELSVGDVIAYQPDTDITDGIPITHRIIAIDQAAERIIVQGDAVPYPDAPIRHEQVIGKMDYFIPYAGFLKVVAFQVGLGPIVPLLSMGLFAYWFWQCTAALLSRKPKAAS
jgi:signal peptidase I